MLHKITGNTEDNRAIKIETNKGKKTNKATRENVEEEKNKDNNDYDNQNYKNYDKDDNNDNKKMMKMTGVMIAMLRSQEVDFQMEVLVFKTKVSITKTVWRMIQ